MWHVSTRISAQRRYRKVFGKAAAQGLAVIEYVPKDKKAIAEVSALFNFVFSVNDISVATYG